MDEYEPGKTYDSRKPDSAYANPLGCIQRGLQQPIALLEVRFEGVMSHYGDKITGRRMTVVRKLSAEEICTAWTGNLVHEDGTQRWFRNGELHREGDLPAVIRADGSQRWFLNGVFVK